MPFNENNNSRFFDLRTFLSHLLKNLKLYALLILICAMAGFLWKFLPELRSFLHYSDAAPETPQSEAAAAGNELPYLYTAKKILYFPLEGDQEDSLPTDAYLACLDSQAVLSGLAKDHYEAAMQEEYRLRSRMIDYNYRMQSVMEEPYSMGDFRSIFSAASPSPHFIILSAKTGSRELSEQLSDELEQRLTDYVESLIDSFPHRVLPGETALSLPQPSNGLIPRTDTGASIIPKKPSPFNMAKAGIKGILYGLVLGALLSCLLGFFLHFVSLTLDSEQDLDAFGIPVLALIRPVRRPSLPSRILSLLDGDSECCENREQAASMLMAYAALAGTEHFLISGTVPDDELHEFARICSGIAGQNSHVLSILSSGNIVINSETVTKAGFTGTVVLFEKLGFSRKSDFEHEIRRFTSINCKILGIILQK